MGDVDIGQSDIQSSMKLFYCFKTVIELLVTSTIILDLYLCLFGLFLMFFKLLANWQEKSCQKRGRFGSPFFTNNA